MTGFKCDRCGAIRPNLPLGYRSPAPIYVEDIPEPERAGRVRMAGEQCILDGEQDDDGTDPAGGRAGSDGR